VPAHRIQPATPDWPAPRSPPFRGVFNRDLLRRAQDAVSPDELKPALSPVSRIHDGLAFKALRPPAAKLAPDLSDVDGDDVVAQLGSSLASAETHSLSCDDVSAWAYSSTYMGVHRWHSAQLA